MATTTRTITRTHNWARRFPGVQQRFGTMTSPPTPTVGGTSSAINANSGGTVSHSFASPLLNVVGDVLVNDGGNRGFGSKITFADSSKGPCNAPIRVRLKTDAPAIEAVFRATSPGSVGLIIDGQYMQRSQVCVLPNSGNPCYVKFDLGPDTKTYELATIAKSAGGSGYVVGDQITLAGGTGTPSVLVVTQVSAGAVAGVDVLTRGSYSAQPTGTIAQASSTGAGTGATFVSPVWSQVHTTRKMRNVEVVYHSSSLKLYGINVDAPSTVEPWPVPSTMPKLCIIGDSQTNGTYLDYFAGHWGCSVAQMLGLWDRLSINAQGGTGFNTPNTGVTPNIPAWSDPLRIADYIAEAADIYLIVGSQNDAAGAPLTAAVTATINALQAALPNAVFVGIGAVVGTGSIATTKAGWLAASDQSRVRFIDNSAWVVGSGYATAETGTGNRDFLVASDNTHLHQAGVDWFAGIAAPQVADAILSMVSV